MPSLNTTLFAANLGEAARQTYAAQLRAQQELVAAQLRDTVKLPPGSTLSALYEYRVGPDGSLLPVQTRITTETSRQTNVQNPNAVSARQDQPADDVLRRQGRSRSPNFADISPLRAELSPADELALFAANAQQSADDPAAATVLNALRTASFAAARAETADGYPIEVELLPPDAADGAAANDNAEPPSSLAARTQSRVAGLYARNNDIVFNVTPLTQFAA